MDLFRIVPYSVDDHREQLLAVWERSVLATHHFLRPEDFVTIKAMVPTIDFTAFAVFCLMKGDELAGFIGVSDRKVETLFLSPDYFGQGLGRRLMEFAITELQADKVDVNEQNTGAVQFYAKMGFEAYERTEKDDQGHDYPLLRMRLIG